MPQASEESRKLWGGQDDIGEDKAENYLKSKGYKLSPSWFWVLPNPEHNVTDEELGAMDFLVSEWDYGGWVRDEEELKKYETRWIGEKKPSDAALDWGEPKPDTEYLSEERIRDYLLDKSYGLTYKRNWLAPDKEYKTTIDELLAIEYLCEKYDYGNLVGYLMPADKAMEFSIIIDSKCFYKKGSSSD